MTGNQSPSPPPAPSGTGDTVRGPGCSLIAATLASRRPVRIRAGSDWLPSWYASHCDGDREHEGGVTIKTLDNPGWAVKMIPPYAHAPDRSDAGQRGMGNRPHSKSQHRAVQGRAGQHREGRQGRVAVPVAPTMLRTRPSRPVRRPLSSWGRPPTSGARSGRGGGRRGRRRGRAGGHRGRSRRGRSGQCSWGPAAIFRSRLSGGVSAIG
ncbi:immunity 53 family protein [Streptomyces caniferus]|uniref:Imm53 family immunity protein n=1 Tax=Streptomyces caniferus TaxID=285557 RepID=UPI002E2CB7C6|nr:Imm53 family immunity protein [Streptomyces caniferus]